MATLATLVRLCRAVITAESVAWYDSGHVTSEPTRIWKCPLTSFLSAVMVMLNIGYTLTAVS